MRNYGMNAVCAWEMKRTILHNVRRRALPPASLLKVD